MPSSFFIPIPPNPLNIRTKRENTCTTTRKPVGKQETEKGTTETPSIHPLGHSLSRHTPTRVVFGNPSPRTVLVVRPASNSNGKTEKEKPKKKKRKKDSTLTIAVPHRPKEAMFHMQRRGNVKKQTSLSPWRMEYPKKNRDERPCQTLSGLRTSR